MQCTLTSCPRHCPILPAPLNPPSSATLSSAAGSTPPSRCPLRAPRSIPHSRCCLRFRKDVCGAAVSARPRPPRAAFQFSQQLQNRRFQRHGPARPLRVRDGVMETWSRSGARLLLLPDMGAFFWATIFTHGRQKSAPVFETKCNTSLAGAEHQEFALDVCCYLFHCGKH